MKYCLLLLVLLSCTKQPPKQEGPAQAALPEAASPGSDAANPPLTPSHANLPLAATSESGEVRVVPPVTAKDQRILDELAVEALKFSELKTQNKKGAELFKTLCVNCHGTDARGFGPGADALPVAPTNFHEWPIKYGRTPADIAFTLLRGRNDGVMPALGDGLPRPDLWSLVYLIAGWYEARPDATKP